ncbi:MULTISPECIES: ribosome maturation factor RimM [Helicobacter]|uniref:Ribosome maturation factor RimM n=1 Tax=Helicobacter typhlonius TaxID=76936 RepID=A0A4U8RYI5_9HELI|nr:MULTISPECIES: ribosome maturation factor RimM [Helicobacter]TLD78370.1 16S rRNA processing protein RimM [Helicobacter typhlonius]TLD87083.1 16S rRNA processing protein RimM [Helicobacter sp. MIT 03-1616]
MKHNSPLLLVAKIGRCIGVRGDLKLHIISDFPSIFIPKAIFHTRSFGELCIESFDSKYNLVRFKEHTSRESAARLVNCELYSTLDESKAMCDLKEGEFLWEEIIGAKVIEKCENTELELGLVTDIERIGTLDYLFVRTDTALVKQGFKKQFLVPNIEQFISCLSPQGIFTHNALAILEQS